MNKLIIYLFLISHSLFAQTVKIDKDSILIGEQIKLIITNPLNETNIWPIYNDTITENIEIIRSNNVDTNDNIISQEFIITIWDSGNYYIPPIKFSEKNITPIKLLNVSNINVAEDALLKDIKQPILIPIGWTDLWPYFLVIFIVLLILFLFKKYYSQNKKVISVVKEKKVPEDIYAINELEKLESLELLKIGKIKRYHSSISEILRRYLELRFKFIALESTTYEIIRKLKKEINKEEVEKIRIILERSDLAKFAKSKPSDKENIESMLLAKNVIISTRKNTENG